jgi:serine protease Do
MARSVMEQIVKSGKVVRGWLGVVIQPVTPAVVKVFGLSGETRGALIGDVVPDGPAAHGGVQRGDIVLEANGQPIRESRDLQLKVTTMSPGAQLQLKLFRNGSEREIPVTLGEAPTPKAPAVEAPSHGATLEGVTVNELTPEIARQIRVPIEAQGVVVRDIEPGSFAADAGLERGDVIQEVNRKPVKNVAEFQAAARHAGRDAVLLLVNRAGTTLFLVVEPM